MRKYRIKIEESHIGNTYTPQVYQNWILGWNGFHGNTPHSTLTYNNEKDARDFIREAKSKEINKITYINL